MKFIDIITNKKNKKELSKEEINFFITNLDIIPDYQISALLMAIVINGMTEEETINLTMAMAYSGDVISYDFKTVDKHSTGGIGDKVTLVVAPIVASLGCKVAKMSGKGLGYTGGTIDKLESIKGFKTDLSEEDFIKQIENINLAIITQSKNISPADKKLYALRDVTATVESMPLIAASIMSKKIASGSKNLVLDVKVGKGAFMKNLKEARELATLMVKIGQGCGINTKAILSNMDIPLGKNIGNQLEVIEAIEVLEGKAGNLTDVCIEVATHMVSLYQNISYDDSKKLVLETIKNKNALNKFYEFIKYQGGSLEFSEAKYKKEIFATNSGYINYDALEIGNISVMLGAGRLKKEDIIDYKAGVVLNKEVNEKVLKGELIATLYSDNEISINNINCISDKKDYELIYEVI